jgi:hypothetical protein
MCQSHNVKCEFISNEWTGTRDDSLRLFAQITTLMRKLPGELGIGKLLRIESPYYTLEKICSSRNITLEEFFRKIKR